jgi:hypothetical protein
LKFCIWSKVVETIGSCKWKDWSLGSNGSGTDVLIFLHKYLAKKNWRFLTQNAANLYKNWIITLVLRKAHFLSKIGRNRRR